MLAGRRISRLAILVGSLLLTSGCDILTEIIDEVAEDKPELVVDPDFGPTVPDSVPESDIASLGERCEDMWCEAGTTCLTYPAGKWCSLACDTSDPYCIDSSLCIDLVGVDYGACVTYGTGMQGDACENSLDCERSLACVSDRGAAAVCTYTCDFSGEIVSCPTGWACTISTAGIDFGLCDPIPS